MIVNHRRQLRRQNRDLYTLSETNEQGETWSAEVRGMDVSASGVRVLSPRAIEPGTTVYLEREHGTLSGACTVRHCTPVKKEFAIGLEFHPEMKANGSATEPSAINYYEFLQISPRAEIAVIQRVYHMLATRLHPDNPETGDPEKFLLLQTAHDVLMDPKRRAGYDAELEAAGPKELPIFHSKEFSSGIEGEVNRRLGILSLLYKRRRTSPEQPGLSLRDVEKQMGFPREVLEFNIWYLKSKGYITFGDNGELALTAVGVDYVEENVDKLPLLERLLEHGTPCAADSPSRKRPRRTELLPEASK